MKFDRDGLMNVNHRAAARTAINVLTKVQDTSPPVQVAAVATVFLALCDHYGIRPGDAFIVAGNMLRDTEERTPEFRAVKQYVANELPR